MRVDAAKLAQFAKTPPPVPPPVEPRLTPDAEVALLTSRRRKDPTVEARWARVRALVHRAATPTGDDAELLALLAAKHRLPIEAADDRRRARQRITGIGALAEPPPAVAALARRHGVAPGDGAAFALALMGRPGDYSASYNGDNMAAATRYGPGG